MSSQTPRGRYQGRRRRSEHPSSSDSEDEKMSASAADAAARRAASRTRRRRDDNESNAGSRAGDDRDRYAVVRRSSEVYAVEPARRRPASVASTGTYYEEYDLRNRGARDRQPRQKYRDEASRDKRKSKLDPKVFLAALFCFAGLAYCWDEITDD